LRLGQTLVIIAISASAIAAFTVFASAEEGLIPGWIKNTANFWVNNQISDREFISALQYLVKEGMLLIPQEGVVTQPSPVVTTQPSPVGTTEPSSVVTTTPFTSTKKYIPNLEAFYVKGDRISNLVEIVNREGKSSPVTGQITIQLFDFDNKEIFKQKKYVTAQIFEGYTNKLSGETKSGFNWIISFAQIKGGISEDAMYNNGLGTMKITLVTSEQSYVNEIMLDHLPFNEGYFNADTGFIKNIEVNGILDVGPFYVTVNDVGQYMGKDSDDKLKEYFRVNLNTQFKYVEGVTFQLDEIYIMDQNNRLYPSDSQSIENFKNVFLGESYEYKGGNGYILFEKIPTDVSKINLVLKITRVESDLSDTHYEDELEISLR